jgi:methylthioribose-1-phosphate isomerase
LTHYPKDIDVDAIEIEERPAAEVFMFLEGNFDEIDTIYPSFDITRSEFVTRPMVVMPSQTNH